MLDELRDLYQDVILDHGRNPRNFRRPEGCNRTAHGNNPICGDLLVVYLSIDEAGVIQEAAFQGKGCAISVASASMMTEIVKGKTVEQAGHIFENFHEMCTKDGWDRDHEEFEDPDAMERLHVLAGVREFPVRVKCATLAWHTMSAAMAGESEVSTE